MSSALTIRHTREDVTARKNAESSAQVKRYRPGKAPAWIDENEAIPLDEEQRIDEDEQEEVEEALAATRVAAPVILKKVADPRLARLAVKKDSDDEEDEVAAPRIVSRRQARDDSDEGSVEDAEASGRDSEEEDDEEVEARRAAVRARLQNRRNEAEEEVLATEGLDEEEEEEEESEYETDSEDEQFGRPMLKPVFVTKKERETIAEREALEKEQLDAMKKEKARVAARAHETKEILISRLRQEEEAARAAREGPKEVGDIDTDDEQQLEADFEAWRVREHQRIRRDREEREKLREAEEEKERLRNMTAEERQKWERENPRVVHQGPKKTLKFMQKYWHKGAFFQEVSDNPHAAGMQPDSIYLRDYSAPTGEDKLNKEMLPKVMQVKNFGRRGRTKYTHLADQDTTTRDEYYMQEGMKQPKRRHAGTDQVFDKPKNHNT